MPELNFTVEGAAAVSFAAAPTLAFVLGLAKRDGVSKDVHLDLYYDHDLGWFSYETTPKGVRVWTRDGCREFKALNTW